MKTESTFQAIWNLTAGQRRNFGISFLLFTLKHSPVWIMPLITANIIDILVQKKDLSQLWVYLGIMMFLVVQNLPINIMYVRFLSTAVRNLESKLRLEIATQLQKLNMGFYTKTNAGVLQTKVIRDVEAIEQMLKNIGEGGIAGINTLLGALLITAFMIPQFMLVFLVMVPLSATLIITLRSRLKQTNQQFRQEVERMSAQVNEMTTLLPVTRAHGLEAPAIQRVRGSFKMVKNAGMKLDFANALFGASAWVAFQTANVTCLGLAVWLSYTQTLPITPGEVVMLTTYFAMLTGSVLMFSNLFPTITRGVESIHSVREILQSSNVEQNEGKKVVDSIDGEVEISNVSFTYPDSDEHALHNIELRAKPNQVIALVGHSGSGKSTLINLIIGFLRPTSGTIRIDGIDIETLDMRSVRRFISVVAQESVLFEGSIKENIVYGLDEVSDEELESALRAANAMEFVERLPDGWDTVVGERGAKLSGGQKQRVAIARALIRDPKVLLLDEATSSLDSESEKLIQSALDILMQGRTTFVVAHRLSTVHKADQIIVLDKGYVVERGTHKDLVDHEGQYKRLYTAQKLSD